MWKVGQKMPFFQMSVILKFDFQKWKQLHFSEVNYLNCTKKDPILHVATTFSLKQGETRTSDGPIPHLLSTRPIPGAPELAIHWNLAMVLKHSVGLLNRILGFAHDQNIPDLYRPLAKGSLHISPPPHQSRQWCTQHIDGGGEQVF